MNQTVTTLGLCLGASTVSVVTIRARLNDNAARSAFEPPEILHHAVYPHDGDPKQTLHKALQSVAWETIDKVAATGRKFRQFLNISSIAEPEAVEYAYNHAQTCRQPLPGGDFSRRRNLHGLCARSIRPNRQRPHRQQVRRRHRGIFPAAIAAHGCLPGRGRLWAEEHRTLPCLGPLFGFLQIRLHPCHQQGVPKSRVTAGLGQMMANKVLELLKKVSAAI
jgi:hypothetical protein